MRSTRHRMLVCLSLVSGFSVALTAATASAPPGPEPGAGHTSPAAGGCLADNGDTDGNGGYNNGIAAVYGGRRALLDDFIVPAGQGWFVGELLHRHVWATFPPGSGNGMEIAIRRDDAGSPGTLEAAATVLSYVEVPTGRFFFGRAEAFSRTEFDPIALGPGHYWLEALVVGPESNFWLTRDAVANEECWVDYADVNGLESGTDRFGTTADLAWCVGGIVTAPPGGLTLEIPDGCQTDEQVVVELWMRDLSQNATGFQAFLAYDDSSLSYRGDLSSYTPAPFPLHIRPTAAAEVSAGRLRLDGSEEFGGPGGSDVDSLLVTLVFDVDVECTSGDVAFDHSQPFESELSLEGVPFFTLTSDTPAFALDHTPPVFDPCPADVTVAADAGEGDGCVGAVHEFTAPAIDNCGVVTVECDPPSGTVFPVGTTGVTCTATDDCGNVSSCEFDVTVTETNLVDVLVLLPGSVPATRCIRLVPDDCGSAVDIELDFVDHDANAATPVQAETTIEVPCGPWTILCAKDEQHTLWSTTSLSLSGDGTRWIADTALILRAGDADGDGDVDLNDTGVVLAQFGGPEPDGGCPWNGQPGGDLNNDGNVGSLDYSLLNANWSESSTCACTPSPDEGSGRGVRLSIPTAELDGWVASRVDVDHNGVFDVRDVERLEVRYGLSGTLSAKMRSAARR